MTMVAQALIEHEPTDMQVSPRREISDVPPMVSMIERIIMDPSIPIERLERAVAMHERMEDRAREDRARQAEKAFFAAMSKCQEELPVVTKTRRNTHTNSTYADLAAIEEQAMPIIHKHGFGVLFQPAGYNSDGELQIKWKLTHDDGHSESDVAGIPVDGAGSKGTVNKTGTQAFGSTATYGRRYLLCMLFNISTGDDRDGNKVTPTGGPISEEQASKLRNLIEASGADITIFCEKWKIDAVPDLPASKFSEAYGSLERWHKSQGGAR